jgi:HEAT repeat protein
MRPKVIIPLLILSGAALLLLFLARPKAVEPTVAFEQGTEPAATVDLTSKAVVEKQAMQPQSTVGEPTSAASMNDPADSAEARQEAYADERIAQLQELAMTSDRDSLDVILSELTNPDQRISKAALEAAVQFGSRDAIPALQDALPQTDDPAQKIHLLKAIEFLKLPSINQDNE